MSAGIAVGDLVEVVSIGETITPPEWVGQRGIVLSVSGAAMPYRVDLPGSPKSGTILTEGELVKVGTDD